MARKISVQQKKKNKRVLLSFLMFAIVVIAVTLSERINLDKRPQYILAGERIEKLNRAIASAQPLNFVEDVHWEHQLVHNLDRYEGRTPAAIGGQPSQMDQLRFGQLAGKYRISEISNMIHEIEYVESQDVSDRPVFLRDRESFLKEHRNLFIKSFEKIKLDASAAQKEVYNLFDGTGKSVGKAAFLFDERGHFISLKVLDTP